MSWRTERTSLSSALTPQRLAKYFVMLLYSPYHVVGILSKALFAVGRPQFWSITR
jgi:hypothetical protein